LASGRPTLDLLHRRARSDFDTGLGNQRSQLDFTVERAITDAIAGASHTMHGRIERMRNRVVPSPDDLESLKLWADVWKLSQDGASQAKGSINITGTSGTIVFAGTFYQRPDDGETFTVDDTVTIDVNGGAVANVTATEAGLAGNTGAGVTLELTSPLAGADTEAVVNSPGLTGGAAEESALSLFQRLKDEVGDPATGGGPGDYKAWALESGAGVAGAWERANWTKLGTVGVFVASLDAKGTSFSNMSAANLAVVQEYLDGKVRLGTAALVLNPTLVPDALTITLQPNGDSLLQEQVANELRAYYLENAEPGFTVPVSQLSEVISAVPGEISHTLSPVSDITHANDELPTLGTITWG